jgi:rare lipoprotein A
MSSVRQLVALGAFGLAVAGCPLPLREPPPPVRPPSQVGVASWYGADFQGNRTASGERFDEHAMTAAHPSLPIGTHVRVINLANGRSVVVRVTDRGPFVCGRTIDVSTAAARSLGMVQSGTARVQLVRLDGGSAADNRPGRERAAYCRHRKDHAR